MYWFVIYAARAQSRARAEALEISPPRCATWRELESSLGGRPGPPARRFSAVLTEEEWTDLCAELELDLDAVCGDPRRASVCEAGPLPATLLDAKEVELPGRSAIVADFHELVIGPIAALALDPTDETPCRGAAAHLKVGLCVAPLPESEVEHDRACRLFAGSAFHVGGGEAELRCPDCASPELRWRGGPHLERQMVCENCGAQLARSSAFLRLAECESILEERAPALAPASAAGGSP